MPTSDVRFLPNIKDPLRKGFTTSHFIVGDFMIIRPTYLRFNEEMRLREDYDYTIRHIKEYGGALRNIQVLPQSTHRINQGGAVDRRSGVLEQEHITKLQLKHPGWFRKAHKPNEIEFFTLKAHKSKYTKPSGDLPAVKAILQASPAKGAQKEFIELNYWWI